MPATEISRALLLFARFPALGRVKTRLAPSYTPEESLELHRALLSDSLELLHRASRGASASAWLYLSEGGEMDPDLSARRGAASQAVQRGDDLGERLVRAFQDRFAAGSRQVVVIGSDTPHLPAERVARAFKALEGDEIVLGPARDGGYYLVGASRLHLSLFRGMAWGTSQVYRETVRRARREGIPIASLPAWYDVDLPESVALLWKDIIHLESIGSKEIPTATGRLLRKWQQEGKTL
ncbi:MAG TPA: TIGR04282 family arsenosugar biosynthesis glycosyltransferase [Candidatus Polarisedimenticolia bacterium]|nr:TIGR04282 family arsenosugar biosynthesis glycosyltransferase [Candidatus Polarisedimenticolia bacterium]